MTVGDQLGGGVAETALGSPEWEARDDLVGRAMRLIADGAVDRDGVASLARRLRVSPAALRRRLVADTGAAADAHARARRAALARVLDEATAAAGDDGALTLRLPVRPPLDGPALLAFLGRRVVPGVEEVIDGAYRRSLGLAYGGGVVELRPAGDHVTARLWLDDRRDLGQAVQRSRDLLRLDADPVPALVALGADALLGPFVRAAPGLRMPGHVDAHELAIRAVLGQQVSVAGAATLAGRLVADCGATLARPVGAVTHRFPTAAALAASDPERLAMPRSRRRALLGLAAALAAGEVELDAGADRVAARRALLALPGIGPWTADYVALRALRDPDAFLADDLGVRHALTALGADGSAAAARRLAERWRPHRATAVAYLWASLGA